MRSKAPSSGEVFRPEHLLIADFQNPEGHYANAVLFRYLVATAGHVADGSPKIMTPAGSEGNFWFKRIKGRDLAISSNQAPIEGYQRIHVPRVGEEILVCGYHGSERKYYEIVSVVVGYDKKGRIIVEAIPKMGIRKARKLRRDLVPDDFEKIFQVGMSGSAGLNKKDRLTGLLTSEPLDNDMGDFSGHRVVLEPAKYLQ